jgi:S1-C subfamily serine protease
MRTVVAIALLFTTTLSVHAQGKTGESLFDRVLRSTVFVLSPLGDGSRRAATGSGSYIGNSPRTNLPIVITNYHVVAPCVKSDGNHSEVRIMFPVKNSRGEVEQNRDKYMQSSGDPIYTFRGRIVAYLKTKDLALVEVQFERGQVLPKGVTTLPLAQASPRPSSRVHTIGNTGAGGMWSYTEGSVRSIYTKKFAVTIGQGESLTIDARLIESSNPTNKGDSGGPLVNDDGELVGVTQGGINNANQLSTFIDLSEVKALLTDKKIIIPRRGSTTVTANSKEDKKPDDKDMARSETPKKTDPREAAAESKLNFAKRAMKVKDYGIAEDFLKQIIKDYDDTNSVVEAKSLLEEVKKKK